MDIVLNTLNCLVLTTVLFLCGGKKKNKTPVGVQPPRELDGKLWRDSDEFQR